MEKKYSCDGSPPRKLLKSDALSTQDLPIDQVKIQSNLISTSAINHSSKMEHKAIKRAHDQSITTIEESQTHPSTAAHISNPELNSEAIFEQFSQLFRDYKAVRHKNIKIIKELVDCQNVNQALNLELELVQTSTRAIESLIKESDERIKLRSQCLKLILKRAQEFKMGHFHMNHK